MVRRPLFLLRPACPICWCSADPTTPHAASAPAAKEVRLAKPKGELQKELFALFEVRPRWSIKEIADAVEQPMQHLRDVLVEIAELNKQGPDKGTWELRREYKAPQPVAP